MRLGGRRYRAQGAPPRMREFDPRRVGREETTAWVTYYRREWIPFLRAAIALTRHTFGLGPLSTLYGAWLVLRANQLWAPPSPTNDPEGARRCMRRFYALVRRCQGGSFDPARASELEVEWWRVHREHQHAEDGQRDARPLTDALAALYAYVYDVPRESVRLAAEQRALAMDHSDRWVEEGCHLDSPLVPAERAALVRSYAALLAAVHVE